MKPTRLDFKATRPATTMLLPAFATTSLLFGVLLGVDPGVVARIPDGESVALVAVAKFLSQRFPLRYGLFAAMYITSTILLFIIFKNRLLVRAFGVAISVISGLVMSYTYSVIYNLSVMSSEHGLSYHQVLTQVLVVFSSLVIPAGIAGVIVRWKS